MPLLEGGGSPLKFVEALAYAVPVAATPRAAAGLEVRAGEHYVEGDDRRSILCRGDLEALDPERGNPLAAAGRELAEREYSIEALERRLARVKIVSVMTGAAPGGAEFAAVELLDALIERGHEAVMLSDSPEIGRDTGCRCARWSSGPKLSGSTWPQPGARWPGLRTGAARGAGSRGALRRAPPPLQEGAAAGARACRRSCGRGSPGASGDRCRGRCARAPAAGPTPAPAAASAR